MDTKQVIVWRHDLNVRKGKMMAQAAHASIKVFLDRALRIQADLSNTASLAIPMTPAMTDWTNMAFAKVVLYCKDEAELDALYDQALAAGLPCSMIVDAGRTEFHGIPTKTCIAIGPAYCEEIDKITGHLSLL